MSLTVSYDLWLSLTVSTIAIELLHASYYLPWLLAVSHCLSSPMELLHVSHCSHYCLLSLTVSYSGM